MPNIECGHCGALTPVAVQAHAESAEENLALSRCSGCKRLNLIGLPANQHLWPAKRTAGSPDDAIPEAVRKPWAEALSSFDHGNLRASLVMTSAAIQVAARERHAGLEADETLTAEKKGGSLAQEVEWMGEQRLITPALVEWGHEQRIQRNYAAHPSPDDPEITVADADEFLEFGRTLFEQLYVWPVRLEQRRARLAQARDA